uniref:AlNc14C8G1046 protein n=1 Tax=Albugo laibachii Nc14 TaxID=890382 RepID=F0W1W7_9STRA|nr:AlNc14C8G1046 [Albugo laibachii Nc14]|eukprot:CCA15046.1 AlNc14C8G1046 [Albugo laibachii Nc14]
MNAYSEETEEKKHRRCKLAELEAQIADDQRNEEQLSLQNKVLAVRFEAAIREKEATQRSVDAIQQNIEVYACKYTHTCSKFIHNVYSKRNEKVSISVSPQSRTNANDPGNALEIQQKTAQMEKKSLLTAKKLAALKRFQSRQSGRLEALSSEAAQLEEQVDALGRENETLEQKLHASKLSRKSLKIQAPCSSRSLVIKAHGKRPQKSTGKIAMKKITGKEQGRVSERITHVIEDDFSLSD